MGTGLEEGVSWIFVVEVKRPLCGARRRDKTKSSNEGDNKVLVWPTIDVYALSFPGSIACPVVSPFSTVLN